MGGLCEERFGGSGRMRAGDGGLEIAVKQDQ